VGAIDMKVRDAMRKLIGVGVGTVVLLVVIAAMQSAQSSAAEGTLTTADHQEIRNLYNRYNHYIDSAKDEGFAYARLFTEDAIFETTVVGTHTGRDELAKLARGAGSSTEVSPVHHAFNIVIDPSPEGAVGSAYYGIIVAPHDAGEESTARSWGVYTDRLVKTADGWRFKHRKFTPAGSPPPEGYPH